MISVFNPFLGLALTATILLMFFPSTHVSQLAVRPDR